MAHGLQVGKSHSTDVSCTCLYVEKKVVYKYDTLHRNVKNFNVMAVSQTVPTEIELVRSWAVSSTCRNAVKLIFKISLVKMFSCLKSQDKKGAKILPFD
jgi:hypothetical protein